MAGLLDRLGHDLGQGDLVVHDQHSPRHHRGRGPGGGLGLGHDQGRCHHGQVDAERRAHLARLGQGERPAVLVDDTAAEGQAEPGALAERPSW